MKQSSLGYTLIELLVAVSIITIIFSLGIAAYMEFNRNQVIVQAVKALKNDIRFAQSKALSGEKDCSVCGGANSTCDGLNDDKRLDGWFISFTSNSYNLYGSCGGTQFGLKEVNLPTEVEFDPAPSSPLQFLPVKGQGVNSTIILKAFSDTKTQTVNVTATGDIN